MTTLEILTFKKTIENYIEESKLPKEVVRMVVKDIYSSVEKQAYEEAMAQLNETKENDDEQSL